MQEQDERLIRRAWLETHHAIKHELIASIAYRMAEERLATRGIFYQVQTDRFVSVE